MSFRGCRMGAVVHFRGGCRHGHGRIQRFGAGRHRRAAERRYQRRDHRQDQRLGRVHVPERDPRQVPGHGEAQRIQADLGRGPEPRGEPQLLRAGAPGSGYRYAGGGGPGHRQCPVADHRLADRQLGFIGCHHAPAHFAAQRHRVARLAAGDGSGGQRHRAARLRRHRRSEHGHHRRHRRHAEYRRSGTSIPTGTDSWRSCASPPPTPTPISTVPPARR